MGGVQIEISRATLQKAQIVHPLRGWCVTRQPVIH